MFNISHSELVHYQVPPHLDDSIEFVEMQRTLPHILPKLNRHTDNPLTDDRYFARESLQYLYNVSDDHLDHKVSGGLVEYQSLSGFIVSDLAQQQQLNRQSPNIVDHLVGTNMGIDAESSLDVQMMSQTADGVDIWFWDKENWLYSFAVDFYNTENVPDVISMSWGWAEDQQCNIIDCVNITSAQYVSRVNREYLKLALRGITIVVSSGDAGAPGRTNEECGSNRPINPAFPGSSPYVLSVGASYLVKDTSVRHFKSPLCSNNSCVTGTDERSINFLSTGWTAGGGFNLYNNQTPSWQNDAVEDYLKSGVILPKAGNFNSQGRAYPDVSAVGHSCPTVMNGDLTGVDGTSCSAPILAGIISLINGERKLLKQPSVGFVNPLLYQMSEKCPECFRDIVDGYNWCTEESCCTTNSTDYGFNATRGFDPVSGLGSLNVGNIIDYIKTL